MPPEGAPVGLSVHATAVAIGGHALLITGRSMSGKSRLAAALVAASTRRCRIVLVGDDRVLLGRTACGGADVRPHPRIAGFIERRGLGLVAVPWLGHATIAGIAMLDEHVAGLPRECENLAVLRLVDVNEDARADAVLAWWYGATSKRHPVAIEDRERAIQS